MIKNMTLEYYSLRDFPSYYQPVLIEILTRRITVYKTNQLSCIFSFSI